MKSPIFTLTHAQRMRVPAELSSAHSSAATSRTLIITMPMAMCLWPYDKLITATRAVEMCDAKCVNKIRQQMFYSSSFNTRIVSLMYTD